jgi:hypothetical protein
MFELASILVIIGSLMSFVALLLILERVVKTPPLMESESNIKARRLKRSKFLTDYVSIVHAVITWFWSAYLIIYEKSAFDAENTWHQTYFCAFSLGYFIYDSVVGNLFGFNDPLMLIHHFMAIFFTSYSLFKGKFGYNYIWTLFIAEPSNPMFLLRKNLAWYPNTKIYDIVLGVSFCLTFLYFRIVVAAGAMMNLQRSQATLIFKVIMGFACELTRVHVFVLVLHDY